MHWRAMHSQLGAVARAGMAALRRFAADADPRISVRGKMTLAILLSTSAALLAAGAAMLTHDIRVERASWAAELETQAAVLARSTAPAIAFDDPEGATAVLAALRARPDVVCAGLYGIDGRLFASYGSDADHPPPQRDVGSAVTRRIEGQAVELRQPVFHDGEQLGGLYLRAQYDLASRIRAYLGILAVAMIASLSVAIALSTLLARIVTRPLGSMLTIAKHIVQSRDYSMRATKATEDEVGELVDAFNAMVNEVEARAQALEATNRALREEASTRHAAEVALAQAKSRLEASMAAAEVGSFVWDLASNRLHADRNLAALFGMDLSEVEDCGAFELRKRVHPADAGALRAAETMCRRSGTMPPVEFRVLRPDGSERWLAMRGKVHRGDGSATLFSALLIDITDRKLAERALADSERLYRAIGESIDYGVWVCDGSGRNVYASDSFLRLIGQSQAQCSDFGWADKLHPDDRDATVEQWRACVHSGRLWYREHRVLGTDGHYHPVLAQGVPIRREDGTVTGWAGINLDIRRLKETEEALRETDRRKDDFLATLAHELRNPLAPITHAVEVLKRDDLDDGKRHWAQEVIGRQIKRMALLLDDLLDVSRITRGKLALRREVVPLESLVEQALETARPLLEAKQHEFRTSLPAAKILLHVDPLRISQALSNLLTNAAKYTDVGGRILLEAAVDAHGVRFRVSDDGIGIQREALPRLFEMFSQLESPIDRSEGGLGIGLALVRGLVELHGGRVTATSAGPGRGTEILVRLPTAVVAEAPRGGETMDDAPRSVDAQRYRVLIADDNLDAANALALVFSQSGYPTHLAYSGKEALEVGCRVRPSVVLLDIGMPGMNGYEVAKRLRQEVWGEGVLLIAITGWGQDEDRQRARAAGFDQHMTKPVDFSAIERLIAQFFAQPADPGASAVPVAQR